MLKLNVLFSSITVLKKSLAIFFSDLNHCTRLTFQALLSCALIKIQK